MRTKKYVQRQDREGFEVPSGEIYRIACCDCGLVHDFCFISHDGKPIGIAAKRNERATAQRRRKLPLAVAPETITPGITRRSEAEVAVDAFVMHGCCL